MRTGTVYFRKVWRSSYSASEPVRSPASWATRRLPAISFNRFQLRRADLKRFQPLSFCSAVSAPVRKSSGMGGVVPASRKASHDNTNQPTDITTIPPAARSNLLGRIAMRKALNSLVQGAACQVSFRCPPCSSAMHVLLGKTPEGKQPSSRRDLGPFFRWKLYCRPLLMQSPCGKEIRTKHSTRRVVDRRVESTSCQWDVKEAGSQSTNRCRTRCTSSDNPSTNGTS